MDVAIPIVFPDYRIAVELEPTPVDLLPWFTFDNFETPEYQDRWSGLGHAGVFFVNGRTGLTKYYEYCCVARPMAGRGGSRCSLADTVVASV